MDSEDRHETAPDGIAWHALPVSAVASLHVVDPALGLSDAEAAARGAVLRENAVGFPPISWRLVVRSAHEIVATLLAAAALASAFLRLWAEYLAALALLLLSVGCAVFQGRRTTCARGALRDMKECPARALRNGRRTRLPASELVPGDIIAVEAGDVVPADGRLFAAEALSCRETPLTEKSAPTQKSVEAVATDAPLGMRSDMIYMGTKIESGSGRAIVVATGTDAAISLPARPEDARSAATGPSKTRARSTGSQASAAH